ncbi:MAG: cytochrome b [Hyphomicrobiaceae bacterium]
MIFNTDYYWGSPAKLFHWVAAALILFLYFHGLVAVEVEHEGKPAAASGWQVGVHAGLGLVLGALMLARYLWRLINKIPMLPVRTPEWEKRIAGLAHIGLYIATLLTILPGLLTASLARPDVSLFGVLRLPRVDALDTEFVREIASKVHETAAHALIFLVMVHVLAALHHHFVQRDSVLKRMLLRGRSRTRNERARK